MERGLSLTIGICAHNEAKNIGILLPQILGQKLSGARIAEIIVVSSGSTDKTDRLVRGLSEKDGRIRLISEKERRGKISAVNRILRIARGDIILLCGADLQLGSQTLERLIGSFARADVGMVGARPTPTNSRDSFSGYCTHLVWDLHHHIALRSPKCGELVAIRNEGFSIPPGINADEAWLEWRFRKGGWRVAYEPDAIVYNHGPENISDFIIQRRRTRAQHMHLEHKTGYKVSTGNVWQTISGLASVLKPEPRPLLFCSGAIFLEGLSIALGAYDFYLAKNDHAVWDVARSTKVVRA